MREFRLTRRALFGALAAGCTPGLAQMASRGVRARPRDKSSGLPFHARFTDVAAQAGLRHPVIYGPKEYNDWIVESIGCGVAFLDYDNDGWQDILVLCGSRFEDAPKDASNRLYRNNRDGTFTDVTEKAGLFRSGWATGVTIGDFDNDGFEDIFITYWGQNVLYRNNGDGTFTDITKQAGLLGQSGAYSSGCSWVDYDRDGRLDLFVASYVEFDRTSVPKRGQSPSCNFKGVATNCGPRGLKPGRMLLYRNNGDGTFTDVSEKTGVATAKGCYGLTTVAADFNDDGWPDVYVACDSTPSLLFQNRKNRTFEEVGLLSGVALNADGQEQAGMGLGVGDFNLDGRIDILKTHFTEDTPALYSNRGAEGFHDDTIPAGLGVETRFVSWGAGIVDLDNDGNPDLFWVTGSVYPELEKQLPQYPYRTQRVLFRGLGGAKFEELFDEAGSVIMSAHSSRGCAFGDFDNDGDLDILILNMNQPPSLLRNDLTGGNNWLKVKLVGVTSNRSAIGARVICRYGGKVQAQEVMAQSSFLSVNDRRLHFGLGKAETADLEIRWPSGIRQVFTAVKGNRIITITEDRRTPG